MTIIPQSDLGRLSKTEARWTALEEGFDMAISEMGLITLDSEILETLDFR